MIKILKEHNAMRKKLNILIVDDDEGIRDLFIRILSKEYNVIVAENGTKAIDLAKVNLFEIAFIDMRMPGLNGCETLTELKKINPDITVVIVTGYADGDLKMDSFLGGAVRFLDKPFDIDEIHKIVRHEIELRKHKQKRNGRFT